MLSTSIVDDFALRPILKLDPGFQPCPVKEDDECYPNGIFVFNITRLLVYIDDHAEQFPIERIAVADIPAFDDSHLDADTVRRADLSRPLLLAEITPRRYNVIDGNHRVGRARQKDVPSILCRKLPCPHHLEFLTSTFAYVRYVEYWNSKLEL